MKIQFNLLPEKEKKYLRIQKRFRMFMEYELHIMIVCLFLVAGLFLIYFFLKTETEITREIYNKIVEQKNYQNIDMVREKFANIKNTISEIHKLEKDHFSPSQLLIMLSENIPMEISLDSIKITGTQVNISAIANTREDVIIMKDKLQSVKYNDERCFDKVSVSEANFSTPVDVFFTIVFEANRACFK